MKFIALTDFFARLSDYFIDDECKAQCFAEEKWSSLGLTQDFFVKEFSGFVCVNFFY